MENLEQNAIEETQDTAKNATAEVQEKTPAVGNGGKLNINVSELVEIVNTVLVSVFVVLLIFTYLIRPVTVQGGSMMNTLQEYDKLLMYRFMYEPAQGDIVVIDNDEGHVLNEDDQVVDSGASLTKVIIKRVIAVSGQTLDIDAETDTVYVDGVPLDETYVREADLWDAGVFSYPITIPEGYIFVMGDNRNHSTDSRSRSVGLVEEDDVLGTTFFRYAPFDSFGFVN